MNPSTEPPQCVKTRASFVTRLRLGSALLILILGSCTSVSARPSNAIDILVYNYARVPAPVLSAAEREAGKILGVTSSELSWVDCAPASTTNERCHVGWTKQSPGLRFIAGFNKYQYREFGHADVPVLATIYYERVARRVHEENADSELGTVLGALVAHELGHLFLEDFKHSTVGVMEPSWGKAQFRSVLNGNLTFTTEQEMRIKQHLELRERAAQDSNGTSLKIEIDSGFLVVVRAQIENVNDLKFIVDTGVTNTVIDRKLADKLRLRRSAGTILSFEGFLPMQRTRIANLHLGPLLAKDIQVYVADLPRFSSLAKRVDGIIGMDVLGAAKKFTIDYQKRTLLLEPADNPEQAQLSSKCFAIPATIQGVSARLLVDTGFPGILLYRDRLLRQLPGARMGPSTYVKIGHLNLTQVEMPGLQVGGVQESARVFLVDGPRSNLLPNVDGFLGPSSLRTKWIEFNVEQHMVRWR
ncbi:MAG TPA: retropepsin-like aspartic protease [Candidatus Acidoferrum sp.]|jgi:predicted aspartyl protease